MVGGSRESFKALHRRQTPALELVRPLLQQKYLNSGATGRPKERGVGVQGRGEEPTAWVQRRKTRGFSSLFKEQNLVHGCSGCVDEVANLCVGSGGDRVANGTARAAMTEKKG